MPLVDMRDMLNHAYHNGYAVGGFEPVSLEFVEAIIQAAESCRAPVILNFVEFHFQHFDFELLLATAEKSRTTCDRTGGAASGSWANT